MELLLALDAGTSGVRAVALDPRARVVDSAQRDLPAHFPQPGWVEHDADLIATLALSVLTEVAERAGGRGDTVGCLGLTNQRETTVAFDRDNGRVAGRAIVWQDRRTSEACADLAASGHGPRVREVTGLVLDPYFSATKMRWLVDHGALDTMRAPALATIDTWLLWRLTGGAEGGAFLTEPSNASRTMLLDLATRRWSAEMAALFGVPLDALADVTTSHARFGEVSASAVARLAGVPITGVLGDQQAALFGQACVTPGQVKATYGTGSFVMMNTGATPLVGEGLLSTIAWDLGEATYALEGSAFVTGAAVQWLRDELGFVSHASELEALAASAPTSDGVTFVPA
ncbi:MAG: FGGY family carbohydrate kinase, partial [Acidimicrobiales bacterium]